MSTFSSPPRRPLLTAASFLALVASGIVYIVVSGDSGNAPPPSSQPSTSQSTISAPAVSPPVREPGAPPALRLTAGVAVTAAPSTVFELVEVAAKDRTVVAAALGVTEALVESGDAYTGGGLTVWASGQWSYTTLSAASVSAVTTPPATLPKLIDEAAARQEVERIVTALDVDVADISVAALPARIIVTVVGRYDQAPLLPAYSFAFTDRLVTASGHVLREGTSATLQPSSLEDVLTSPNVFVQRVSGPTATAGTGQVTIRTAAPAWLIAATTTTAKVVPGWELTDETGAKWAVAADTSYRAFVPPQPSATP